MFNEDTLRHVAELARIELSDEEVKTLTAQLGNILGYIAKLNQLDTTGVEPMVHAQQVETPMRGDEVRPSPGSESMLACAPEQLHENFKVPQVIGGGH